MLQQKQNFQTWIQFVTFFCLVLHISESPASQHLRNAITQHPKSLHFKCIPKTLLPVSSASTQNVGIFSGFSSIFTSQKNCDLCEHIISFFGLLFYSQPHEIHNTDLLFLHTHQDWNMERILGERREEKQTTEWSLLLQRVVVTSHVVKTRGAKTQ